MCEVNKLLQLRSHLTYKKYNIAQKITKLRYAQEA